jgi:hypothetical protein
VRDRFRRLLVRPAGRVEVCEPCDDRCRSRQLLEQAHGPLPRAWGRDGDQHPQRPRRPLVAASSRWSSLPAAGLAILLPDKAARATGS